MHLRQPLQLVPPTPETIKAIRELVAGVSGFTPDRGDQMIVETLPFESTLNPEPVFDTGAPAAPGSTLPLAAWMVLLRDSKLAVGAAAGALLMVAAGVVFLVTRKRKKKPSASAPAALTGAAGPAGQSLEEQLQARLAAQAAQQDLIDLESLQSLKMPKISTKKTEVLSKQLKENIKKDSSVGAHVLRAWITDQG